MEYKFCRPKEVSQVLLISMLVGLIATVVYINCLASNKFADFLVMVLALLPIFCFLGMGGVAYFFFIPQYILLDEDKIEFVCSFRRKLIRKINIKSIKLFASQDSRLLICCADRNVLLKKNRWRNWTSETRDFENLIEKLKDLKYDVETVADHHRDKQLKTEDRLVGSLLSVGAFCLAVFLCYKQGFRLFLVGEIAVGALFGYFCMDIREAVTVSLHNKYIALFFWYFITPFIFLLLIPFYLTAAIVLFLVSGSLAVLRLNLKIPK